MDVNEEVDLHSQRVTFPERLLQVLPGAQARVGLVVGIAVVMASALPAGDLQGRQAVGKAVARQLRNLAIGVVDGALGQHDHDHLVETVLPNPVVFGFHQSKGAYEPRAV